MSSWFDAVETKTERKPGIITLAAIVLACVLVLGLLLHATANAEEWPGTVMRVVDGDTLIVADAEMVEHTIRVLYVDTPEARRGTKASKDAEALGIPVDELIKAGKAASTFTAMMLDGSRRDVSVNVVGKDVYGRELATVYMPGVGDLATILTGNGMAKIYRRAKYPRELVGQEDAARRAKSGFWKTIWK